MKVRRRCNLLSVSMPAVVGPFALATAFAMASPIWALPGTTNLALLPGATATATGADFGSAVEDAIDGNRDGNFGDGSVFYGNANPASPPLFYEVDLGVDAYIDARAAAASHRC